MPRVPHPGLDSYAWAFRESADYLLSALQNASETDTLIALPCIYLYRHALEVAVKDLLTSFADDLGIQHEEIIGRGHSLTRQADDIQRLAGSAAYPLNRDFRACLAELEPYAMKCRYPRSKKTDAAHLQPHEYAGLPNFHELVRMAQPAIDDVHGLRDQLRQDYFRSILGGDDDGTPISQEDWD